MTYAIVAFVAYVSGCFSHKWAAALFKETTGADAHNVANKTKDALEK